MSQFRSVIFIILIIATTIGGVLFIHPDSPYSEIKPWRLGLDLVGGSYLVYEVDMSEIQPSDRDIVMNGLRDVIERRVNLFGVSEPRVTASESGGNYRLNVELAGISDVNEAINQIGETPFLQFSEVVFSQPKTQEKEATIEGGVVQGGGLENLTDSATKEKAIPDGDISLGLESVSLEGLAQPEFIPTELTGRYIKRASLIFDNITNTPQVFLEFDGEGADLFAELTGKNIGKPIAIFLDGDLISAPRVSEKISGGRANITGDFTLDEARRMVERFNAGALPAPINLINQQTISASLGQDSLQKTVKAGIWGTLAVMIFMILYYGVFGIYAVIALFIYTILTLSIFKLFVTMTLAGIAGFVLSIGMAVDANILIFERIKEEIKKGASKVVALEDGFKRAWPSIRDSNSTTILTTFILYYLTSSFVKGFALTLMLGVLVSMFTAITITRNLLRIFSSAQGGSASGGRKQQ